MEKEIRNISNHITRNADENRLVEGVAIVFNEESRDMGFIETIKPTAIDAETIANSDVFCLLNHDDSRGILARSCNGVGSLQLELKEDGLHYRFVAPNTQLGDELLSNLERGEITTSSFAFTVANNGDKWYRTNDGVLHRDINKIERLYDVSPVYQAAYAETSVCRRRLDEIATIDEKLNNIRKEIENL
jgi:HK97 family phage prohead protease